MDTPQPSTPIPNAQNPSSTPRLSYTYQHDTLFQEDLVRPQLRTFIDPEYACPRWLNNVHTPQLPAPNPNTPNPSAPRPSYRYQHDTIQKGWSSSSQPCTYIDPKYACSQQWVDHVVHTQPFTPDPNTQKLLTPKLSNVYPHYVLQEGLVHSQPSTLIDSKYACRPQWVDDLIQMPQPLMNNANHVDYRLNLIETPQGPSYMNRSLASIMSFDVNTTDHMSTAIVNNVQHDNNQGINNNANHHVELCDNSTQLCFSSYDEDNSHSLDSLLWDELENQVNTTSTSTEIAKGEGVILRKKVTQWNEDEHKLFLLGLRKYGRGDWKSISRNVVVTRSSTQVASHAQKFFQRLESVKPRKRTSIHDIVNVDDNSICELVHKGLLSADDALHLRTLDRQPGTHPGHHHLPSGQ